MKSEPTDAQPRGPKDKRLGRIHDRLMDAIARVDSGVPADRALSEIFKGARDLGSSERAYVGDTVYGVFRRRAEIDDVLARAAKAEKKPLDLLDAPMRGRLRVLTYLALEGDTLEYLEALDKYGAKRLPKVLGRICRGRVPPSKATGVERIANDVSLPVWITGLLVDAFGEARADEIGRALATRAPVTLRVHARRTTREAIIEQLAKDFGIEAKPTRLSPHGLTLPKSIDLYSWSAFQNGLVELQDEGSQLIALAVGVKGATSILDACAGAGGKALALAALTDQKIVAMDPEQKKLRVLEQRAKRAGAERIIREKGELETLDEHHRGRYDRVLVDAPCTGTGTLRRHPDLKWRLEPKDVTRETQRQRHLLTSAAAALRPGGLLLYATCSVLHEENEAITAHALEHDQRLERAPLVETLGPELAEKLGATYEARIGPGPTPQGSDGFYIALMRRTAA